MGLISHLHVEIQLFSEKTLDSHAMEQRSLYDMHSPSKKQIRIEIQSIENISMQKYSSKLYVGTFSSMLLVCSWFMIFLPYLWINEWGISVMI